MDPRSTRSFVERAWRDDVLPALREFIRIPNQSPGFDPDWEEHGHVEKAVRLARDWVAGRDLDGLRIDVLSLPGRTPLLLIEVDGTLPGTILLYGHLDKQPPFEGWREGLGPWTPVEEDGRLYGRGAADDGYAVFAAITAVQALRREQVPHPRLLVIVESSEESGSPDLPAYMDAAAGRIGEPDLVICLDSGCGDYRRLWATSSLRGLVVGTLRVDVLREGVHSGAASGIVPSSFRILRRLLGRLEDSATGRILPPELHVEVPAARVEDARRAAEILGAGVTGHFPWSPGTRPVVGDVTELLLGRTWRPALAVTGQEGLPTLAAAGNVLRPGTALKLSLRVPPTLEAAAAGDVVKRLLERDPPHGAGTTFTVESASEGWEAPSAAPWLSAASDAASRTYYGEAACAIGEGGSIPFMALLGARFPRAQFLITGVLGPESNAHGPNEFLHLGAAHALTASIAEVISRHPGSRSS